MVDDSLDGPPLASLWALQHVAVNAQGLGLRPANVSERTRTVPFTCLDFFLCVFVFWSNAVKCKASPR
jgi:hypothetical protein